MKGGLHKAAGFRKECPRQVLELSGKKSEGLDRNGLYGMGMSMSGEGLRSMLKKGSQEVHAERYQRKRKKISMMTPAVMRSGKSRGWLSSPESFPRGIGSRFPGLAVGGWRDFNIYHTV